MCEKDMDIKNLFESLKQKIEEIDAKYKTAQKQNSYASNPFAFYQDKTYVWIEKAKK